MPMLLPFVLGAVAGLLMTCGLLVALVAICLHIGGRSVAEASASPDGPDLLRPGL